MVYSYVKGDNLDVVANTERHGEIEIDLTDTGKFIGIKYPGHLTLFMALKQIDVEPYDEKRPS